MIRILSLSAAVLGAALALGGVAEAASPAPAEARAPSVTVTAARTDELREMVVLTGSFVAREEVLVPPEVEGLAIVEILAEEGDHVAAGQVLVRLNRDTLDVLLAQNSAQQARSQAAIAQAQAQIAEANANKALADLQLQRTRTLQATGAASNDQFDQRQSAARAATARLDSARNALLLGEADLALAQAQRRDIEWRITRTEVRARVGGVISRRNARLGAMASGAGEPMYRIIAEGAVELEAEVPEAVLARLRPDQTGVIEAAGRTDPFSARVRLVAPEVNRTNRLGRVRIALGPAERATLGAFGRATIEVQRARGVVVPLSAVFFSGNQSTVQVVKDGVVETRPITVALRADGRVLIRQGLAEGEDVVAVSGSFVRNGDRVTPVMAAR